MTDIELHQPTAPLETFHADPTGGRLVAWASGLAAAHKIGTALCRTTFAPKHFAGKPEEAAAAIMFGDEIGLTPTQSLRSIHVISGTPGLYARAMVALVQSRGHDIWTETDTPEKVTVCGRRKGSQNVERSEWTTARARKAGYLTNKKYETDPQAMLYARAASDICRKIAADALAGLAYTVEEMELEAPQPVTRVTRRKAEPKPMPEPELEATSVQPEAQAIEGAEGITDAQLKMLHASFNDAGITERDTRLDYCVNLIARNIESSKDLTKAEATRVIDALVQDSKPEPEPEF